MSDMFIPADAAELTETNRTEREPTPNGLAEVYTAAIERGKGTKSQSDRSIVDKVRFVYVTEFVDKNNPQERTGDFRFVTTPWFNLSFGSPDYPTALYKFLTEWFDLANHEELTTFLEGKDFKDFLGMSARVVLVNGSSPKWKNISSIMGADDIEALKGIKIPETFLTGSSFVNDIEYALADGVEALKKEDGPTMPTMSSDGGSTF